MEFKLPEELYDKKPEDFNISKEAVAYFKRKKFGNVKDIILAQNELCKTPKGKEYYTALKVQLCLVIMKISGMIK